MLLLDLGCGPSKKEGYTGVDMQALPGVDVVCNLDFYPWPWEQSSVDGAYSSHVVEHIRDLVGFMSELYRVCKPGAQVEIHHPYQFNVRAWQDPTHVRCLNEVSWFYFDAKWRNDHLMEQWPMDFELVECDAIPEPNWAELATVQPQEFERAARNQINVVSDLHVILKCRK